MSGSPNLTNVARAAASSYRGTEDERVLRASIRRLDGSDELAEVPRRTVLASRLEGAALPRFLPPRAAHADERNRALSADDGPLLLEGEEAAERAAANVALVAVAAAGLDFGEFTRLVKDIVAHQEARTAEALATAEVAAAAFERFDADRSGEIDPQELSAALSAMCVPGDAASVRQAIAAYGEGHRALNVAEFTTLARGVIAAQKTEAALAGLTAASYRAAFDRFDADTSGTIEAKELQPALAALMPGRTFALDEVVKIMSTYETVRHAAGAAAKEAAPRRAAAAARPAGVHRARERRDRLRGSRGAQDARQDQRGVRSRRQGQVRDHRRASSRRRSARWACCGRGPARGDRRYGGARARTSARRVRSADAQPRLPQTGRPPAIPTAAYKQAFDRFDTDKSGTIEEFRRALAVLMPGRPNDERETAKIPQSTGSGGRAGTDGGCGDAGVRGGGCGGGGCGCGGPAGGGGCGGAGAVAVPYHRLFSDHPGGAAGRRPGLPAPAAVRRRRWCRARRRRRPASTWRCRRSRTGRRPTWRGPMRAAAALVGRWRADQRRVGAAPGRRHVSRAAAARADAPDDGRGGGGGGGRRG